MELKTAIAAEVKSKFSGFLSKELGVVIDVAEIDEVGEGIIIPGDGAAYYETTFDLITFEPEIQEVINGKVKEIADFGLFYSMGPLDGMIHISQTMNDFVSFSKDKVLQGKDSHRSLKVGDQCRARIIAVSFKEGAPKIGLTMRQAGLGKEEWIEPDLRDGGSKPAKPEAAEKTAKKK
jgi:DNA-directed RNA polymerase subunit E'